MVLVIIKIEPKKLCNSIEFLGPSEDYNILYRDLRIGICWAKKQIPSTGINFTLNFWSMIMTTVVNYDGNNDYGNDSK